MNHDQYLKTSYFKHLDALRCLSILLVVWYHTGEKLGDAPLALLRHGFVGVYLFFVISGFLITTLLLRELGRNKTINYTKFFLRRALRIFPLYYAVLLIYCVLVFFLEKNTIAGKQFFENLPYFLTYTSNFFVPLTDGRVIFYFAWSLAAEEQFYLIWPLLLKFLGVPLSRIILLFLTLALLATGLSIITPNGVAGAIVRGMQLPICLGVILALTLHSKQGFTIIQKSLKYRFTPVFLAFLLLLLYELSLYTRLSGPMVMTLLLASLVISNAKYLDALALWAPVIHIGKISYGIYLLHMLSANVIKLLQPTLPFLKNSGSYFIFTLLLSVILASISFSTFERYFLEKKHKYSTS